jgi:hypothetical protein
MLALLAFTAPGSAARRLPVRHWPDPPAWWVNGSFATCVRIRESGNGTASGDIYGILPFVWASLGGTDSVYTAARAEQDYRAWLLYERDGTAPWRPYDGC